MSNFLQNLRDGKNPDTGEPLNKREDKSGVEVHEDDQGRIAFARVTLCLPGDVAESPEKVSLKELSRKQPLRTDGNEVTEA